jgi:hypothetical protein
MGFFLYFLRFGGGGGFCARDPYLHTHAPHQHHPPPNRQDTVHSVHLYNRPTLMETRTQPATVIDRRTPTTR